MSNIPVSWSKRTASHPAWTPVSVDGTAVTGAVAGGVQPFGIGVADKDVGGNTFLGDSGQMIMISGYYTADDIRDHTGDGDSAAQMRSVNYEIPGTRQFSCVAPAGWEWMAEVPPDGLPGPHEAPDDHRGHLRHRNHCLAAVPDRQSGAPHRVEGRAEDRSRPDAVRCGD